MALIFSEGSNVGYVGNLLVITLDEEIRLYDLDSISPLGAPEYLGMTERNGRHYPNIEVFGENESGTVWMAKDARMAKRVWLTYGKPGSVPRFLIITHSASKADKELFDKALFKNLGT